MILNLKRQLTLLLTLLLLLVGCTTSGDDDAIVLSNRFTDSPTGFAFDYPDGWRYTIPAQNLLVLDQPREDLNDISPAMTVQRSLLLTAESSMRASMEEYLRVGPLRERDKWTVSDVSETTLENGQRPALVVSISGSEGEDLPEIRTDVYLTEADSGMVYVFALSALVGEWEAISPTLEAVLGSVRILE